MVCNSASHSLLEGGTGLREGRRDTHTWQVRSAGWRWVGITGQIAEPESTAQQAHLCCTSEPPAPGPAAQAAGSGAGGSHACHILTPPCPVSPSNLYPPILLPYPSPHLSIHPSTKHTYHPPHLSTHPSTKHTYHPGNTGSAHLAPDLVQNCHRLAPVAALGVDVNENVVAASKVGLCGGGWVGWGLHCTGLHWPLQHACPPPLLGLPPCFLSPRQTKQHALCHHHHQHRRRRHYHTRAQTQAPSPPCCSSPYSRDHVGGAALRLELGIHIQRQLALAADKQEGWVGESEYKQASGGRLGGFCPPHPTVKHTL